MQNSGNNRAESTRLCKNRAFCFFTHPEPPGNSRTFDYLCYGLPLRSRFEQPAAKPDAFPLSNPTRPQTPAGGFRACSGWASTEVMWATARRCAVALGHSINRSSVVPGQGALGMSGQAVCSGTRCRLVVVSQPMTLDSGAYSPN
jgi:hypothetical protein